MTKTKEELIHLRTEYKTLTNKLKELTKDELNEVIGGSFIAAGCDVECNLNPDACLVKKASGFCPKSS